ncbi:MAG: hypothetical protein J3K34DRAFT_409173 [Monoraphidium minutum]|nr:MAG: hypothetical protein J3K34DRAFT_409173 [Monoraphidium minutum]
MSRCGNNGSALTQLKPCLRARRRRQGTRRRKSAPRARARRARELAAAARLPSHRSFRPAPHPQHSTPGPGGLGGALHARRGARPPAGCWQCPPLLLLRVPLKAMERQGRLPSSCAPVAGVALAARGGGAQYASDAASPGADRGWNQPCFFGPCNVRLCSLAPRLASACIAPCFPDNHRRAQSAPLLPHAQPAGPIRRRREPTQARCARASRRG